MANKRALLVGINAYPTAPLRGCVNDVMLMSEILTKHFGFDTKEKRMLTDASATTANILERLNWLVDGAQPGDVLFFHYSGHGSQMIDSKYDTDEEPDGLDEIICPVDLNWRDKVITDDQLRAIFDKVPAGVNLTIVMDCCHSGSGMDHVEQYQPLGMGVAREFGPDSPNRGRRLPMPADIANRGIGLNLKERRVAEQCNINENSMMISGCQSHQTSADAFLDNRYVGAATHYMVETLEEHNFDITYKQLVDIMNQKLEKHRFTQRPELNGNSSLHNTKVLMGEIEGGSHQEPPSNVDGVNIPQPTTSHPKKDKK